ncbi:BlaI/MecI/CopY family transcriptional regulator [Thermoanaerobacterium sp. DL9XJH110]|uniref:BlaI/MecI/CopY family transcriptional regulator n=1 Tax=Thermoanaerobacterium sp. DL9XJH110 TaxID=3386643 RepID=UPI003BB498F3
MKTFPQISEAELEVMKVLWDLNCATSSQIADRLIKVKKWKPKTVQTLINRLVAKGAVKAEKKSGKAFLYSPLIGESEFKAHASSSFLQKVFDGSLSLMIASFIKEKKLSKREIEDLKKILEEDV